MISQEQNKKIWDFWGKYHNQLEEWIGRERIENLFSSSLPSKAISIQFHLLKNAAIKEHISSTHTWIKDTSHQNKDNIICYPFECKVCGQAASGHEEIWTDCLKVEDVPSRDMHNHPIYRTCQQVLEAKKKARVAHKGGKCRQCNTYGCFDFEILNND
jgi:hypothetical protein